MGVQHRFDLLNMPSYSTKLKFVEHIFRPAGERDRDGSKSLVERRQTAPLDAVGRLA
jgi:hypothetical protein